MQKRPPPNELPTTTTNPTKRPRLAPADGFSVSASTPPSKPPSTSKRVPAPKFDRPDFGSSSKDDEGKVVAVASSTKLRPRPHPVVGSVKPRSSGGFDKPDFGPSKDDEVKPIPVASSTKLRPSIKPRLSRGFDRSNFGSSSKEKGDEVKPLPVASSSKPRPHPMLGSVKPRSSEGGAASPMKQTTKPRSFGEKKSLLTSTTTSHTLPRPIFDSDSKPRSKGLVAHHPPPRPDLTSTTIPPNVTKPVTPLRPPPNPHKKPLSSSSHKPMMPPPPLPGPPITPTKKFTPISRTSIALLTDVIHNPTSASAELLGMHLLQNGVPEVPVGVGGWEDAGEREMRVGLEVSPQTQKGSRASGGVKFLRGGLADLARQTLSRTTMSLSLWYKTIENSACRSSDLTFRISRILQSTLETKRSDGIGRVRSRLAMCTVIEKGDEESGEVMVLFCAPRAVASVEEGRRVKVWKPWQVVEMEGEVAVLCSRFIVNS